MKANSSFPHPVLGVNKGVLPDLENDARVLSLIEENGDTITYTFELRQGNRQISDYLKEGRAQFVCEVDCEKTLYKRITTSNTGTLKVNIKRHDVVGHIDFSFYIVTLYGMPRYVNSGFNPDYRDPVSERFPSFNLEKGAVLALFPSYQDNVDLRFNNKPELNAFIQVIKGQPGSKDVLIDVTNDIINIELPIDMYADFLIYNKDEFRGIFYSSMIFNALVKGILNISDNDSTTWADSITAIMEASPDKYKGLSLDNPADAVDIASVMLSNPAYGTPYDLLFSCIKKIQE